MRILLVEDDLKIASFIQKGLSSAGFAVDHAGNGEDGLHLALTEPYDAAIVDIMLPKLDGLKLIEEIRREVIDTPIIILSARDALDDRIKGLQTGGDDYLTKPFAFSELLARIQALIRRSSVEYHQQGNHKGGAENRSSAAGVCFAGIPHAERRAGCLQNNDHGACLAL
jgi:two-component system OmpR family response regulator